MIPIPLIVFTGILVIATIAIKLGYDPIWFIMLCAAGAVAVFLMNYAPIYLSWWIIAKLFGG